MDPAQRIETSLFSSITQPSIIEIERVFRERKDIPLIQRHLHCLENNDFMNEIQLSAHCTQEILTALIVLINDRALLVEIPERAIKVLETVFHRAASNHPYYKNIKVDLSQLVVTLLNYMRDRGDSPESENIIRNVLRLFPQIVNDPEILKIIKELRAGLTPLIGLIEEFEAMQSAPILQREQANLVSEMERNLNLTHGDAQIISSLEQLKKACGASEILFPYCTQEILNALIALVTGRSDEISQHVIEILTFILSKKIYCPYIKLVEINTSWFATKLLKCIKGTTNKQLVLRAEQGIFHILRVTPNAFDTPKNIRIIGELLDRGLLRSLSQCREFERSAVKEVLKIEKDIAAENQAMIHLIWQFQVNDTPKKFLPKNKIIHSAHLYD